MAERKFRYNPDNLLTGETALTLGGFTADAAMPVANLWEGRSSRRCSLLTAKSGSITCDFGIAVTVDHVALINHNLTNQASFRVQANVVNSFSSSTPVDQSHDLFAPDSVAELAAPATYRYWRITITDTTRPSADIKIGELIFGAWTEFQRNPDWSFSENVEHETISHETDGGAVWVYQKFSRHTFALQFTELRENELQDVRDFWNRVGGSRTPFLIMLDDLPYYVRTRGRLVIARPIAIQGFELQGSGFSIPPDFSTGEITLAEESRGLRVTT